VDLVPMSVVPLSSDPVAQYAILVAVGALVAAYGVKALGLWVWGKIQRRREQRR
jgi:hypothetical protein